MEPSEFLLPPRAGALYGLEVTQAHPLQLRSARLTFARPHLLAVLNVTPDSFSDGGRYAGLDAALARADALLAEGADLIDIGGESARPGAAPVSADEERARVLPVVRALTRRGVLVSIDTTKVSVARAALDEGAELVNDVGTGEPREALAAVASSFGAGYLAMHTRGTPATMRSPEHTRYDDGVLQTVLRELESVAARARSAGLRPDAIAVDPGIGFAKTAAQSLALLTPAAVASLRTLGYAVCVGPSRKSFIDAADAYAPSWRAQHEPVADATKRAHEGRIGGTAAAVTAAVLGGAELLRVHDVSVMRQAARVAHAMRLAGEG